MSTKIQRVYIRTAAGEWHQGLREDGRVKTDEQCNLAKAIGREEYDELPDHVEGDQLCRICFG